MVEKETQFIIIFIPMRVILFLVIFSSLFGSEETALNYFENKDYISALIEFERCEETDSVLLGKALCHACLNEQEETEETLGRLHILLVDIHPCSDETPSEECRRKVRESSGELKRYVACYVSNAAIAWIFNSFIDGLEKAGLYCCKKGSMWTTCAAPIVDKLKNWKEWGIPTLPWESE